jgi:FtsH-binding integral membrane protein
MAGTIRTGRQRRLPRLSLNSDGRPHPLLNAASFFTLIIGLVSFALGLFIRSDASGGHGVAITAAATGLVALLVGLYTQMVSATREERVIIVTGIIAGFVGLALGLAHGGLGG